MKHSLVPILFLGLVCAALVAIGCSSNTNSSANTTRSSYYTDQPGDYTTESGYGTDQGYTPEESENMYGGWDPEYRDRSQFMGDEDMIPPTESRETDSPAGNYGD